MTLSEITIYEDELITVSDVAYIFAVSTQTVDRWRKAGKLPYIRTLSGRIKYNRREIIDLRNATMATVPIVANNAESE